MARTTHKQIEATFRHVRDAAIAAGIEDAATWSLDYAACYGGWCVERNGGSDSLGAQIMNANRMTAGPFVQALRMMLDVFERMSQTNA